jgi:Domain of unknown function (DUF4338)
MVCRGLMLKLHRGGRIELPPVRRVPHNPLAERKNPVVVEVDTQPLRGRLAEIRPLEFRSVRPTPEEPLFNSLLEQYHYLGYKQPVAAPRYRQYSSTASVGSSLRPSNAITGRLIGAGRTCDLQSGAARPSEGKDGLCCHLISPSYFSTRKLPRTRASMPELKNVLSASVGVWTIASPRRLKEVFMITGTPVRSPNSSISR